MMRKCHSNCCPVGVATQDPELRKHFSGKPEYIINFLHFIAQEVREHLAALGLHSLQEACGRCDLLSTGKTDAFSKKGNLDFTEVLKRANGKDVHFDPLCAQNKLQNYDRKHILPYLRLDGSSENLDLEISNVDRSAGIELSNRIVRKFGECGLDEDSIYLHLKGCAGQSFGAFLAPGITMDLQGVANDFVGKGLSGGKIIIRPPENSTFIPEENVIAGNVIGYGGTSGKIFINGLAGERFAIRNSGMYCVAEGVGDHGCEYMTGGTVVILGKVGVNFAAGMTGGFAYVYDENGHFDLSCNMDGIDLESVECNSDAEKELKKLIKEHLDATHSPKAKHILDEWECHRSKFVRIYPVEYRHALEKRLEMI